MSYTAEKKMLLTSNPFFAKLDSSYLDQLLEQSFELNFAVDEVIVSEGDSIKAVYLILAGRVEVSKCSETTDHQSVQVPELVLTAGDAIGFNEAGLFSKSSKRTATLTALSPTRLIGWEIEVFAEIFNVHSHLWPVFKESLELILRVNFIEKLAIFTALTKDQIIELAKKIQKKTLPEGSLIFKEGDFSADCYLLEKGQVEISIAGQPQHIILEPSTVFGEMALLSNSPRNATAKMLTDGSLLVLDKQTFELLMHMQANVAEFIMSLAMERSRPVRMANVQAYPQVTSEGEEIVILKNIQLKTYYKLSPLGVGIWHKLDGLQSIAEIMENILLEHGPVTTELAYNIIFDLYELGFVHFPSITDSFIVEPAEEAAPAKRSLMQQLKVYLRKILVIKFIFTHIDNDIERVYAAFAKKMFHPFMLVLCFSIAFLGLVILPSSLLSIVHTKEIVAAPFTLALLIFFTNLLLVIIHELAHAFTVKFYGREIHRGGLIFYWIGLFAFVDTSDMWLSHKRARIIVDLAGVAADFTLAGIASLCAFGFDILAFKFYFSGLALILYYDILMNLNPLYENDGYNALKSHFEDPKLVKHALRLLQPQHFKDIWHSNAMHAYRKEIIYWLICFVILGLTLIVVYAASLLLIKLLPSDILGFPLAHLTWLFPSIMAGFFLLKIFLLYKNTKSRAA